MTQAVSEWGNTGLAVICIMKQEGSDCALQEIMSQHLSIRITGKRESSRVIFWDITPCTPLKDNGRFGEKHHLHFQGRRISKGRNQLEAGSKSSRFRWTVS
jgi:hypothetical protein